MEPNQKQSNNEPACIWMSAGIVKYKLCDRNMDCEHCQFDRVMRGLMPASGNIPEIPHESDTVPTGQSDSRHSNWQVDYYLNSLLTDCKICFDRGYHRSHFWCKMEDQNTASVGIDKLVLKILQPVEQIVPPEPETTYFRGQLTAWIIRKNSALPLYSPLKGKVTEINPAFLIGGIDHLIQKDACLFKLEGERVSEQVQQYCDEIHSLNHFKQKIQLIKDHLAIAFRQNSPDSIGLTMADGGAYETDLEKIIGTDNYMILLNKLFKK